MAPPLDRDPLRAEQETQLEGAVAALVASHGETDLVDRQPQVFNFVVAEPEPARKAGRGHPRKPYVLRLGWDNQAHLAPSPHPGFLHRATLALPAAQRGSVKRAARGKATG